VSILRLATTAISVARDRGTSRSLNRPN